MLLTHFWYPTNFIPRYDFLLFYALFIQVILLVTRLESIREVGVILLFHLMATGMEIFKTHDSIGSWSYPSEATFRIGNVPLFAGFMYSAVGSYLARVWRGFEFRFDRFPQLWLAATLAALSYLNFFTHHFWIDIRWFLIAGVILAFFRTRVAYRIDQKFHKMNLLLGFFLVALFIWIAENISTFAAVWVYPNQSDGWKPVGWDKWTAWFLLMQLSFVLVYALRKLEGVIDRERAEDTSSGG